MQLFVLGLNHQTAPVAVREKFAFAAEELPRALADLTQQRLVREAAIISTCNRTEIYCNARDPESAVQWLAGYHQLRAAELQPFLYQLPAESGVRHAFRLASGLDSMVVGETQILGQIKQAVRTAEDAGTLGVLLNKLFQRTFAVAKEVRTRTEIGAHSVSLAAAGVRLAERIFPNLAALKVLLVGAGEMIELCATHFHARQPRALTVANRTVERARDLAERFQGQAITLQELPAVLHEYDIVITSTGSTLPLIGKGMVESALKARKRRPMFMLDLAVPRDIEAEVGRLSDVFLYTVDDLAGIVQEGRDARSEAMTEAEVIIQGQVDEFMHWLVARNQVPLIRALRDQAERFRRQEVQRAERRLAKGDDPQEVIESLSHALTNKLLHPPTQALNLAQGERREDMIALLARIYHLHDQD